MSKTLKIVGLLIFVISSFAFTLNENKLVGENISISSNSGKNSFVLKAVFPSKYQKDVKDIIKEVYPDFNGKVLKKVGNDGSLLNIKFKGKRKVFVSCRANDFQNSEEKKELEVLEQKIREYFADK